MLSYMQRKQFRHLNVPCLKKKKKKQYIFSVTSTGDFYRNKEKANGGVLAFFKAASHKRLVSSRIYLYLIFSYCCIIFAAVLFFMLGLVTFL